MRSIHFSVGAMRYSKAYLSDSFQNDIESSRRLKTEFMVQLCGAHTQETDRILFIGATNRPEELDEAVKRRLEKRLYIPLPNSIGRS